jgi:aldose 1-epimerase
MEAARLVHRQSGRVMTVLTNEACLQLYTGVGLDGSLIGKSGVPYRRCAGLCLECEGYPDGANTPGLGDVILRPDRPIHRRTLYQFSTLQA